MPSVKFSVLNSHHSLSISLYAFIKQEQIKLYLFQLVDGDGGMKAGDCFSRAESSPLNDTTKSLVLVNFFRSVPLEPLACAQNSQDLSNMLQTCHAAAANRWANFLAVDYYKV